MDLFEEDGYEKLMRAMRARASTIGAILQVKRKELIQALDFENEKRNRIDILQGQATQFEHNQDFAKAIDCYYEIETIDYLYPDLYKKIAKLEGKLNNDNEVARMTRDGIVNDHLLKHDTCESQQRSLITANIVDAKSEHMSTYRIKAQWAYGVAILIGLMPAVLFFILFSMDK